MRSQAAYALIGLAMAGRSRVGPGRCARLHGAADQALGALGHALEPLEGWLAGIDRQRLRVRMDTEAYEAEYAAGRALTTEQLVDLALGNPTPSAAGEASLRRRRPACFP